MRPPCLKAFLLSAGLGTRLRPLTDEIPKCLLPIAGKPLLRIWLENLASSGIQEVLINTHWLSDQVEAFLQATPSLPVRVTTFYEPMLLGSAGTILVNRNWVEEGEPFFILYGDNLTKVNLPRILTFHRAHGLPFTLGVFKAENPRQCGIATINEAGLVTAFEEKPPEPQSDLAAAGIYVADHRIFQYFPDPQTPIGAGLLPPLDLGFHVLPRLVGRMKAYLIEEFLMDIGTPGRYQKAQTLWDKLSPPGRVPRLLLPI